MSAESNSQNGLREIVAAGLYRTGALRALRRLSRSYELCWNEGSRGWRRVSTGKYVILCYHRVGTEGIPLYCSLAPDIFEMQMRYISERYRIVSLMDLRRELEEPKASGQAVVVTFDDGYRDLYTAALPILKKYNVPATVFLTVGSIETGEVSWYDRLFLALQVFPGERVYLELDKPRFFELRSREERLQAAIEIVGRMRRLPDEQRGPWLEALEKQVTLPVAALADRMLTWEQIREMQRFGIGFGSHTMTHPVVSRLSSAALENELRKSKQILEDRLDCEVLDFAYPFGHPDDCGTSATPLLIRCGYRSACTTSSGVNTSKEDLYHLRRVQLGNESSRAMISLQLGKVFLRSGEHSEADRETSMPAENPLDRSSARVGSER